MTAETPSDLWRRCSSCKKPIAFGAEHYVCNVSTCNRGKKGFVFCTVSCWDAHLGIVRHRESWAEDARAPTREAWKREQASGAASKPSAPRPKPDVRAAASKPPAEAPARSEGARAPRRIIPGDRAVKTSDTSPDAELPREVLVVISKLKKYVKAKAGIQCSDRVAGPLSDAIRELCDEAIRRAIADERKTLLERDFKRR